MPRCQRTFRLLGEGIVDTARGNLRWPCPYCSETEVYETVWEPDVLHYLALAQTTAYQDFGTPNDAAHPVFLLWGLTPECVYEPQERRYDIYLQQASDPYQARLQIGHEMFHRACSQGKIFHWTHEMLACLFSIRMLRLSGADEYADQMETEYLRQAELCTEEVMVNADLTRSPYPVGLYGRAYYQGKAWSEQYGWAALCQLSRISPLPRMADIEAWLSAHDQHSDFREHVSPFLNQNSMAGRDRPNLYNPASIWERNCR